uniref:Uncharacterized protein n=1 Tax=Arundo donax TaxID=35708 RepID=A0A0A9A940_ARUDO
MTGLMPGSSARSRPTSLSAPSRIAAL